MSGTTGGTVKIDNAGTVGLGVMLPPPGSSDTAVIVAFTPVSSSTMTAAGIQAAVLPPGVLSLPTSGAAASFFQLEMKSATSGQTVTLGQLLSINITVPPDVLALAGGNAGNVGLERYNATTGLWEAVTCTSTSATELNCLTDHLSLWAVVIKTVKPGQTTPSQPAVTPAAPALIKPNQTTTPPSAPAPPTGLEPSTGQRSSPYALLALVSAAVLLAAAGGVAL
ncbi:MAG: hypothetical protein EXR65_02320 [Dehalococcoidia bacterium]|nr:hypothetical protein [Dehalococcoidia bacterium]